MKSFIKRVFSYVLAKLKYKSKCIFNFSATITLESSFEGANKIYPNTYFNGCLGYGSYVGPNSRISATVGRFTSIAPYVKTNLGTHPISYPYLTTCPMFYSTQNQCGYSFAERDMYNERRKAPVIGSDCWIGENVFIVGGCIIGDGAVVLAGAVVTKDVPPFSVVGGVPAKVLSYRYDEETIKLLLDFRWWDKDLCWLKENWELLCDINMFKKHIFGCNNKSNK